MNIKRRTADGWPIYKEWVEYEHYDDKGNGSGKRSRWVLTACGSCSVHLVPMHITALVRNGPERCDGCEAYQAHLA